ncbi:MAG TPA: hypothetical protein VKZ99_04710 [Gammaproteobacteria bacterium]|nr:hypothetical protein [Gammaproteobacteria bacterium]
MNHETTRASTPTRALGPNDSATHLHKHAAVERWLRRERERPVDSSFRWFG